MLDLKLRAIRLRNNLFGPPISAEEMTLLKTRADVEGWSDWLAMIEGIKSTRNRRWWFRYIIDGRVLIHVDDPYHDDDPYEME